MVYRFEVKIKTHGSMYDDDIRGVLKSCKRPEFEIEMEKVDEEKELNKKGYDLTKIYTMKMSCGPVDVPEMLELFKKELKARVKTRMKGVVYYHVGKIKMEMTGLEDNG